MSEAGGSAPSSEPGQPGPAARGIVLAGTEGNRFCIVDLGHDHAGS